MRGWGDPMTGISRWGRWGLIGSPFAWLALFFLLPLLIVAGISFTHSVDAIPPYTPLWTVSPAGIEGHATFANYREICDGCVVAYAASLGYAALTTVLCLLIGYPIAFAIARAPAAQRQVLLFLVMLPFWTSFLIRVYAWIAILQPTGLVNRLLMAAGLIDAPLPLLYNGFSLVVGMVYS